MGSRVGGNVQIEPLQVLEICRAEINKIGLLKMQLQALPDCFFWTIKRTSLQLSLLGHKDIISKIAEERSDQGIEFSLRGIEHYSRRKLR